MNTLFNKKTLLIILFFGLAARISLMIFFSDNSRLFHDADSTEYLALAENLMLGNGFTWDKSVPFYPNSFRTPVYPGFLFLARYLFGHYEVALVIQSILMVLSGYILYLIGREYIDSKKIIYWSVGVFLFTPFSLNVSVKFLTQPFFLFFLILAIWSWVKFLKTQRSNYFMLTSFLLPILALIRPIAQYILIVFILSLGYSVYFRQIRLNWKQFVVSVSMMCVIFFMVLMPWLVRNYKTFGFFKLSSITPYQMYFYEVPDAYALANHISITEAGNLLRNEIDDYSKVSDFGEYMKFTSEELLMSRSYHYLSQFPEYFVISRLKNMTKFFLRDGIRYWYNDFNRDGRSEISIYKIVTLKERNLFPYLAIIERLFLALLFVGMTLSFSRFFKENTEIKAILVFFFLVLAYFSFLTGGMASAGFRIVVEPIFILIGLVGLNKFFKYYYDKQW